MKFSVPPILLYIEPRVVPRHVTVYEFSIHTRRSGEHVQYGMLKIETPPSYTLYVMAIRQLLRELKSKGQPKIFRIVCPFRDIDTRKGSPSHGLQHGWRMVSFKSLGGVQAFIDDLSARPRVQGPPRPPQVSPLEAPKKPSPAEGFTQRDKEVIRQIARQFAVKPRTIEKRIKEGKTLDNYAYAFETYAPKLGLRLTKIKDKVPLDEILARKRTSKESVKKLNRIAKTLGVSRKYMLEVLRGKKPTPRKWKGETE